ncbi:MAG: DNA polymerase III subunit gamma/tau [Fermentimonas sp.]|jgi:DNA polymerase-3 subunit gamma/tau
MDDYIVSARKYRPSTFKSVVGQEALTQTLKNAIQTKKLAHAYLFSGPRGVGKTTCARIFAKTINCLDLTPEGEACNKCESCVAFNEQRSYNIHELDAASNNSVDDIRTLIEQVRIPPQIGKYKVYIVDEVHMLSQAAFNSFLKTLEEPPAHAIFILATTEKQKIIPTILSRCQVYDFNRITVDDIVNYLQYVADNENIKTEPEALNVIAQKADGGMRDALSLFDQTASFSQGNVTYKAVIENLNVLDYEYYFRLTDAILKGDVMECLLLFDNILSHGFEGQYVINGLATHFRDLLVSKDERTVKLFQVGSVIRSRYVDMAKRCDYAFLYQAIDLANDCDLKYRESKNRRLLIELALIKMCQLNHNPELIDTSKKKPLKTVVAKDRTTERREVESKAETVTATPTPKDDVSPRSVVSQPEEKPAEKPKKSNVFKGMGVSLKSFNETKGDTEPEEHLQNDKTKNNDPYTEEDLVNAWKEYAENLQEEKLLKNTMTISVPKQIGENHFEVVVNSEINKEYILGYYINILSFLRKKINNDNVKIDIKITKDNVVARPLSPREVFDNMVEENNTLQELADEFGLEIY